jgi:hypothetical protein
MKIYAILQQHINYYYLYINRDRNASLFQVNESNKKYALN